MQGKRVNGFTIVEILIVIVVVAVLGGLGFVAYNNFFKKNAAAPQATASSTAQPDAGSVPSDAASVGKAEMFVDNFFANYIKATDKLSVVKANSSSKFISDYQSRQSDTNDSVVCVFPKDVSKAQTFSTGSAATKDVYATVEHVNVESSDEQANISVLVTLIPSGSTYQIDTINCPHP